MQPRTHRHRHARRGETRRQRKRADVKRSAATRAQWTNCCQHDGTTQTKMAAAPAGAACSRQKEIPGGGGRTTDRRGEFRVLSTNHIPSARAKRFPRGPLRLRSVGVCLFFYSVRGLCARRSTPPGGIYIFWFRTERALDYSRWRRP